MSIEQNAKNAAETKATRDQREKLPKSPKKHIYVDLDPYQTGEQPAQGEPRMREQKYILTESALLNIAKSIREVERDMLDDDIPNSIITDIIRKAGAAPQLHDPDGAVEGMSAEPCHHSKQLLYISGDQLKCALCEVGELRKERDALKRMDEINLARITELEKSEVEAEEELAALKRKLEERG